MLAINSDDGAACAQVLVLLAGYARGRCARLQRDWGAACSGLAECLHAAEVPCCLYAAIMRHEQLSFARSCRGC